MWGGGGSRHNFPTCNTDWYVHTYVHKDFCSIVMVRSHKVHVRTYLFVFQECRISESVMPSSEACKSRKSKRHLMPLGRTLPWGTSNIDSNSLSTYGWRMRCEEEDWWGEGEGKGGEEEGEGRGKEEGRRGDGKGDGKGKRRKRVKEGKREESEEVEGKGK